MNDIDQLSEMFKRSGIKFEMVDVWDDKEFSGAKSFMNIEADGFRLDHPQATVVGHYGMNATFVFDAEGNLIGITIGD